MSERAALVGVAIGNTRTRVGLCRGRDVADAVSLVNTDVAAIVKAIVEVGTPLHGAPVVIAAVNPAVAGAIEQGLDGAEVERVYRFGRDLPIPIRSALDDASSVGQDRLLNAIAAHRVAGQACAVIDAGTAVTVDFVDGEGTFQGGVIAPGLRMMLGAMHAGTAALPLIEFEPPDTSRGPFGKDTRHAMLLGVQEAVQGLVRVAVERFAEAYEAYPQVIATGGDAEVLFREDGLVEHIVPDLQLMGIAEACMKGMELEQDEAE